MAVKKKSALSPEQKKIRENILQEISDLLDTHLSSAMEILEDSEKRTVSITHASVIDCSESVATTNTRIRFASTVTDERGHEIDDPKQPRLPGTEEPEDKKKKADADKN
jgi:hypothetical protein